jgi:hypothetical protein
LVSLTARTLPSPGIPAFRSGALHLRIDLVDRHRRNAGFGHAIGDLEERVGRLLAPDRVGQQPFERLRRQEAGFARSFRRRPRAIRSGSSSCSLRQPAVAARRAWC